MSVAPYPEYKDSGVEWIGELPTSWNIKPLKHLANFINGEAFKPTEWSDEGTPIIRIQNLNGGDDFNCFQGEIDPRYHVRKGDLLFGWSGNRGTSFGPFVWFRDGLYFLNQHIFKVLPNDCERQWFYWCLKAVTLYVEQQAHGIIGMVHVTKGTLGAIAVPLPPSEEQSAIAAFLDQETRKIDALVAEQERLIALLKEKRQAVISQAVTKGLNPNAPMKDSGIEWLGQVPAHWEVKRLRLLATVQTGIAKGKDIQGIETVRVPYLRVANVQNGFIDTDDVSELEIAAAELGRYLLRPGDVLMNEGGDFDKLGRGQVWDGAIDPCIHQNHVFAVRPHSIEPEWLALVTSADCGRFFFMTRAKQSTNLASISSTNLLELPVPCPEAAERLNIIRFVRSATAELNSLITEATQAITLLRERRAALISAAVTGKIDVRSLAPTKQEAA
jgi:type I restriction enzyme S subunit